MARLKTFEEVKEIFASNGCELLESNYINCRVKMRIKAMCGHETTTSLMEFNAGHNRLCKKCIEAKKSAENSGKISKKYTNEEVSKILKARGLKPLSGYVNATTPIRFFAKCGHECRKTIHEINSGSGDLCTACKREKLGKDSRKSEEQIIKEFESRGCRYLSGYKNAYSKVEYIAKCGHKNTCTLHNFLRGQSSICGKCASERWQGEEKIASVLQEIFPESTIERQYKIYKPGSNHPLMLDFFIPSKSLAIEYNGEQHYTRSKWFGSTEKAFLQYQENDNFKKCYCKNNGIRLIVIDGRRLTYKNITKEKIVREISK